ncbi:hypothetical protein [Natronospora cellulosivora (SeqCode)]
MKKISIYIKESNLDKIKKEISSNIDYSISEKLTMVEIDFIKDDLLNNISKLLELLKDNEIEFIELLINKNNIYLYFQQEYKNKFIKLFDKIKGEK